MCPLARRTYLAASATAVGTVVFAGANDLERVPTEESATPSPDDRRQASDRRTRPCVTDLERDENGDIDFEFDGLSFETEGRAVAFTLDGDPFVDVEVGPGTLDLDIRTGEARLELETDGDEVEVDGTGDPVEFEKDGADIDYRAPPIDVSWDGRDLDIDTPVSLEWENGTFEFRADATLTFDAASEEFEFECARATRGSSRQG